MTGSPLVLFNHTTRLFDLDCKTALEIIRNEADGSVQLAASLIAVQVNTTPEAVLARLAELELCKQPAPPESILPPRMR